jgi:hypothetical protein
MDRQPDDWTPQSCTLPTAERPLRRVEFDDLFAHDVIAVAGAGSDAPPGLRLELRADPEVAARVAHLAARETGCCSFFSFGLAIGDGSLALTVSASPAHQEVLTALRARAESRLGGGG